jgi:hypothetical protein
METDFNKKLVSTVLKHIPKNEKAVTFLVNSLNISRESAYRRIRGDISFTVNELATLSTMLDFSIDTIFDQERQNHAFYDYTREENKPNDFFTLMLKKYSELLEKIYYSKKVETTVSFNAFPPPFYADFSNLFKFSYYKWLYQDKEILRNESFTEIVLPKEAIGYQRKIAGNLFIGKIMNFILDTNVFLNLIKEIQYFYQRKLLSKEEMLLLKEEVLQMIEQYDDISQTGISETTRVQLYLSSLCVNTNTICFHYEDRVDPLFWVFTFNPVIIQNAEFISMQKKWLNSLKRRSVLITQSNEILQSEFFFQQREYINKHLAAEYIIG